MNKQSPQPDDDNAKARAAENKDGATELQNASEVERADVELGVKLASNRHHPAVKAASVAGKIGDQGPLYIISAGLLAIGIFDRDRRLVGSGVAMLAAIGAADLSKSGIKRGFKRTRPHVLLDEQRYETEAEGSPRKPEQSFPSGHTAGSVAAARALSRNFPVAGAIAGVAALAIGVSRVAKGAHWPLDVLGGATIGLVAEVVANALLVVGATQARASVPKRCLPDFGREK